MALLFQFIATIFRWTWKLITFIKDLILNLSMVFIVLAIFTVIGFVQKSNQPEPQDGALVFNLTGVVVEEPKQDNPLRQLSNEALGLSSPLKRENSLFDIIKLLRQAKHDEKITGLVLSLENFVGASQSSLEYIGKSIAEFKESGKPVFAVANNYTQGQYYLASFADRIYLTPQGSVGLQGLAANNLYYKSLLDKLMVSTHIFRVGTYKSAVEPLMRDDMSPEAKENTSRWLNALWGHYASQVAENRKMAATELVPEITTYIKKLQDVDGDSSTYALSNGLVDEVAPYSQVMAQFKKAFGTRLQNQIQTFKSVDFYHYLPTPDTVKSDQIAIVVVNGTISSGEQSRGLANAETIVNDLQRAQFDENVQSVILRINSPGGGVIASEAIRSAVEALVRADKPVVVSMGGMAASGGYWISTPASYVIASPSTITGSIGIFGVLNTFERSLEHIGVYTDGVTTSPLAAATVTSELDENVAKLIQISIDNGYQNFIKLVANARNKTPAEIDKVAQGQVWLGSDALKLDLVDELGDFDDALRKAAELAQLEPGNYSIKWYGSEPSLSSLLFGENIVAVLPDFMKSLLPSPVSQVVESVDKQSVTLKALSSDGKNQYVYCLNCEYSL